MVDPIFTYVGGIAFLVLIIGSVLYLMYDYEGVDDEDSPNETLVRGAGPVAAEAEESAVEGGAEGPTDAVEADAGEAAEADEEETEADEEEAEDEADADDGADESEEN